MCYNKKKHALAGKGTSMKKITIITGHYGSGKTNLAVNLALRLADAGEKVTIVDFDIVNPYFRTADFAKLFEPACEILNLANAFSSVVLKIIISEISAEVS